MFSQSQAFWLLLCLTQKRKGNNGQSPAHFCPALECAIMLQMVLKTVLMVEPESWDSRVAMSPGLEYHCPSRSSHTWTFIKEKICSFVFRTTKIENITSGACDVIANGNLLQFFSYQKQKFCLLFCSSELRLANVPGRVLGRQLSRIPQVVLFGSGVVVCALLQKRKVEETRFKQTNNPKTKQNKNFWLFLFT